MPHRIPCATAKKTILFSRLQYVCQINNLCLTFTRCNLHKIKHFMTLYWLEGSTCSSMQHHGAALQYFILSVRTQYFWEYVTTKTHKQSTG